MKPESVGVGGLIITSYVSKVKRNITSFHWLMPSNAQGSSTEQQQNKTQHSVSITAPHFQFVHPIMVPGLDPLRKLGPGTFSTLGKSLNENCVQLFQYRKLL